MTTAIDTPDAIEHWRIASAISMLRIEVKTGMKAARYSLIVACEQNWGCPKKTKAGALTWMLDLYEKKYGWAYGEVGESRADKEARMQSEVHRLTVIQTAGD